MNTAIIRVHLRGGPYPNRIIETDNEAITLKWYGQRKAGRDAFVEEGTLVFFATHATDVPLFVGKVQSKELLVKGRPELNIPHQYQLVIKKIALDVEDPDELAPGGRGSACFMRAALTMHLQMRLADTPKPYQGIFRVRTADIPEHVRAALE